jgi:hypothetical protein
VTSSLVASGAIVPDAWMESAAASTGWSADRAFTELYFMPDRAMDLDKTLHDAPPDMPSAEHSWLAQLERSAVMAALGGPAGTAV